jgi:hypothetical protein
VDVSPSAIDFGNVRLSSSKTRKAVLTNTARKGGATVTFSGIALQQSSNDFQVSTNCLGAIRPKKQCRVTVSFRPHIAGGESAKVVVNSNASNKISFSVSGTGVAPKRKK